MNLSILETAAVLSSFFIVVWGFFLFEFWLDKRESKRKAKEAYSALPLSAKIKHTTSKVAKTNIAKKVSNGAKRVGNAVGVPASDVANVVGGIANKAADVAGVAVEHASKHVVKASGVVVDVAKVVSKEKTVKRVVGKAKEVGKSVSGFFRLEAIDDEEENDDE